MNNPFRYSPHPLVRAAADELLRKIPEDRLLHECLSSGKMMGVLVVRIPADQANGPHPADAPEGQSSPALSALPELHVAPGFPAGTAYLAAFSGNLGQTALYPGFVPPIYDLTVPDGPFKRGEAEITAINEKVAALETAPEYRRLLDERIALTREMDTRLEAMRQEMLCSKKRRETERKQLLAASTTESAPTPALTAVAAANTPNPAAAATGEEGIAALLATLTRQSQFEKAQLKRLKKDFANRLAELDTQLTAHETTVKELKALRAQKSDALQHWIFEQYQILNANGQQRTIWDIFQDKDLIPPSGTGECAAPKLLQYAYLHGLQPLSMGEFWYGTSPQGTVRNHGHFYPSCSSKCGILLPYMMQGLPSKANEPSENEPSENASVRPSSPLTPDALPESLAERIIFEDRWLLAIDKPSGMPSVPGLDGRRSALGHLQEKYPALEPVHRLDMDTSGLLLFAKDRDTAIALRRQFENRTISKTYRALLTGASKAMNGTIGTIGTSASIAPGTSGPGIDLSVGAEGIIDLPLAPDYEDRPRQKVDFVQGKRARTSYRVEAVHEDGSISIIFHPHEGRTHQLRVHAAHHLGLGRPILGDTLYGGTVPVQAMNQGVTSSPGKAAEANPCSPAHGSHLHLQACSITFTHPATGEEITLNL